MRTPAGSECPYYFEDFHRGRSIQECRLIDQTQNGGKWTPDLCGRCTVPRIVMANGCPNLQLEARARSGLLGLGKKVEVGANCSLSFEKVDVPEIGCGRCHENLPGFSETASEA